MYGLEITGWDHKAVTVWDRAQSRAVNHCPHDPATSAGLCREWTVALSQALALCCHHTTIPDPALDTVPCLPTAPSLHLAVLPARAQSCP